MKGPFGVNYMDGYNLFVVTIIAHLLFGTILGILVQRWKRDKHSIIETVEKNE
jgi:hypothetical protein